jgi:hypothetical protein
MIAIDAFDARPLRIGDHSFVRQASKRQSPLRTRRDRYPVNFEVAVGCGWIWIGGASPTTSTRIKIQRVIERRFCGERSA